MLWVPTRGGDLPECWLNIAHVVSIYYAGDIVFIERERTTSTLQYEDSAEAMDAARRFVLAMEVTPSEDDKEAYPKPLSGSIRKNA